MLDGNVGAVLDKARAAGLREGAVVVFTSDHGYALGEHASWGKSGLYELHTKVPLMISMPGVAPRREASPVGLVDLYPTLTAIAKVGAHGASRESGGWFDGPDGQSHPLATALDGHSLVPLLRRRRTVQSEPGLPGGRVVVTQMLRCFYAQPNPVWGDFSCRFAGAGGAFRQGAFDGAGGPLAPLMGYSARSLKWRYVAWYRYDVGCGDVAWHEPVWAEELYDVPDTLDDWDHENLLAPSRENSAKPADHLLEVADAHLRAIRGQMRRRRARRIHAGLPRVARPSWATPPSCAELWPPIPRELPPRRAAPAEYALW